VTAPGAEAPSKAGSSIEIAPFPKAKALAPDSPVLILDGQQSLGAPRERMRYVWKQTAGEDLSLKPERMSKARVGLLIYHPGEYRFQLVVSDGEKTSSPAEVVVRVQEVKAAVRGDAR
jgi:hypothetical protein